MKRKDNIKRLKSMMKNMKPKASRKPKEEKPSEERQPSRPRREKDEDK